MLRHWIQEEDYDAPHVDVDAVKANLKANGPFWFWSTTF